MKLGLGLSLSTPPTRPPPDVMAPTFTSGTCGPVATTITLTFSEPVTWSGILAGIWGKVDGAPYTIPGSDFTLSYVSGKGTRIIVLSISPVIQAGQTVTAAYQTSSASPPDNPGNVTDLAGNAMVAFGETGITNLIP